MRNVVKRKEDEGRLLICFRKGKGRRGDWRTIQKEEEDEEGYVTVLASI